jgi:hypothetical protein
MDASLAYTFNKYAKITGGQQKVPLSYESLRTDYDIHSMSRSQVVEALTARSKDVLATAKSTTPVNNNGRDIGVLFSGGVPNTNSDNPQATWVDYYLGVFDGMGINQSDADKHKDISGRVVVHPIKFLGVGGSFYQGKATYGGDVSEPKDRNRFGFEASYEDGKRIYAAAEFLQGKDSAPRSRVTTAWWKDLFFPKNSLRLSSTTGTILIPLSLKIQMQPRSTALRSTGTSHRLLKSSFNTTTSASREVMKHKRTMTLSPSRDRYFSDVDQRYNFN